MVKKRYQIINEAGVHAKPATSLVSATDKFICDVTLIYDNKKIDFKSIIGVLSLGVGNGEIIELVFDGIDEIEASRRITDLFKEYEIGKEI